MAQQLYDAQQALGFVVNQTHVINPQVYATDYPDYDYARLVFVDTSSPEWAGGITTFISDKVGAANWQTGYAKDVPLADINMDKVEKTFEMAAIGYQYNIEEVGKAQFLNIPLSTQRAEAARQAYAQFMYNLALFGSTEKNYGGLTNYSGVGAANMANDGTGSSRLWADKTPTLILRDINEALTAVYSDSKTVEMADTILLPITAMTYLAQTPFSSTTMETVMSFILRTNIYTLTTGRPLTIRAVRGLEDAGDSSTGRMVVYKNDPLVVRLHLPMPHRFLPVWQNGPFNFTVPGIFRTGGIEITRPGAFRYRDGMVA